MEDSGSAIGPNVVVDPQGRLTELSGIYVQLAQALGIRPVHNADWTEVQYIEAIHSLTDRNAPIKGQNQIGLDMDLGRMIALRDLTFDEMLTVIHLCCKGDTKRILETLGLVFAEAQVTCPPVDEFEQFNPCLRLDPDYIKDYASGWNNFHLGMIAKYCQSLRYSELLEVLKSSHLPENKGFLNALRTLTCHLRNLVNQKTDEVLEKGTQNNNNV